MTARTGFFTIASKNYLSAVRVLMDSIRRCHPDSPRFLVLCDEVDGRFDANAEPFGIVLSRDLGIPDFRRFAFQYTLIEFNTAVKATAFRYLFRNHQVERLIYLDPDIQIYRPLEEAFAELEQANLVLTPHKTDVSADDGNTWLERKILRGGVYNLGFLGLRQSPETQRFLAWWEKCLATGCQLCPDRGLFVDQKWLDMVPALFEGVRILRHPGYNVAYWNLAQRPLTGALPMGCHAASAPLVFYHFSGYSPLKPDRIMSYEGEFALPSIEGTLESLLQDYRQRLMAHDYAVTHTWPYAYGVLSDGTPIRKSWRKAVLRHVEAWADIPDLFDVDATPDLVSRLNRAARTLLPHEEELWRLNYQRLARVFPVNLLLWCRRRMLGLRKPDE